MRRQSGAVRFSSGLARTVSVFFAIGLAIMLGALLYLASAYGLVKSNIEQLVNIQLPQGSQATRIYARDYDPQTGKGTLLATLYLENRQHADYSEIPPALIACVLSTEDKTFYTHGGVDFMGNIRALARIVLRRGEVRGGASTITQQLARNVFLPYIKSQKTLNRKVQEIILAGALEREFSKQEILEAYLNHIFMGHGAYGLRAAAHEYFAKDLGELNLAECALLAGLPQLPSKYDPYSHPEAAEARRQAVLRLLERRIDSGFFESLIEADPGKFKDLNITREEVEAAIAERPKLNSAQEAGLMRAPYFTSYLRDFVLYPKFGEDEVLKQGMIVVTTIDPQYQAVAEKAVQEKIDEYRKRGFTVSQGALVLMEAKTGEILACVGGYKWGQPNKDGDADKYNRAMQAKRQTGSSFKPFTYATAYEQGFDPSTLVFDGPYKPETERTGKVWPNNSDHTYRGWMSMFLALQHSRNAAAVDIMNNLTSIPAVINTARKMGITADLPEVPALTLGVASVRPVEMAEAYTTFPNMGRHTGRTMLKAIYNQNGILVESDDNSSAIRKRSNMALSPRAAWIMVQNMRRVVNAGTGTKARVPGVEIAGKTGTCDDFKDAWFSGYSPELVCTVWVGNDNPAKAIGHIFGGDLPAQIFQRVMNYIYNGPAKAKPAKPKKGEEAKAEPAPAEPAYASRYTQHEFVKPEGVDFAGFGAGNGGSGLKVEGEEQKPGEGEPQGDANGDGKSDQDAKGDDNGFYEPYKPPHEGEVFF